MFFRYLQLRHAVQAQFPAPLTVESDPIERLHTSSIMGKPLSSLYLRLSLAYANTSTHTYQKWATDFTDLDGEEWETCTSHFVMDMISAGDRFLQLKFLHRAYFTQQRLAAISHPKASLPVCVSLSSCPTRYVTHTRDFFRG